ncbi:delta 9-fatty acid desaturase protein [Trametes versicolor FP-101664 SS1]|uniref:delta 9-fatty acid desaturase protein n=1 Tax=Trametes versicolor (strain FP-101664) TaxID=717944 RepID=UPI0004622548|nr:delta 9-fatty acid desaturase protein [Trametes versicolor FP-101664 SS1]EIW55454.1 delta 9-fatty acid desaturase protein [Trametes versicolor FP-101664 SS1]
MTASSTPTEHFPTIRGVKWPNMISIVVTHILAIYGGLYVTPKPSTAVLAIVLYFVSTLGITAGSHRLWSHRSFKASAPLRLFLVLAGGSAVQGSAYWWAKVHRSHHRYIDTDKDPYSAQRGFLFTHVGWIVFYTDVAPGGGVDLSDLHKDKILMWQHNNRALVWLLCGYILPTVIPGYFWGDWAGGLFYSTALRLTACYHSVWCINSLAHMLGHAPFDDKHTPRDHLFTALVTMGEGYHNFHHQFPMDYRNAFRWYQYDPTKWFIAACGALGLASNLRTFPSNEVHKGMFTMRAKELRATQESLTWPTPVEKLPVVTWENFQEESKKRTLLLVSGFIHDVTSFLEEHPGGDRLLTANTGKDVTAKFFGGVYDHSHAAHNLLSMMRVGILQGGVETLGEHAVPPAQKYYVSVHEEAD